MAAASQTVEVTLEESDIEALKALASKLGMTLTGASQRAIRQSKSLDELEESGNILLIDDGKRNFRKVTLK